MNKAALKSYAPAARLEFIQAVTDRAKALGLSAKAIEPAEVKGDVAIIAGQAFPKAVAERRAELERQIRIKGFEQLMEEVAYTWFNRFCALRFMEVHDYLDHGYRVLSNPCGSDIPEILEKATSVDLPGLDKGLVADLRLAGNKDAELYRVLLMAQCNALHAVMPMLFEKVGDATELLLPENLLQTNSPVRKLVAAIPEEDWQEIEILGWLYQFYISEKKDQVIGKVVKSEDIPAATQLFTPNWIVKYMVQNTLGRTWMMTHPDSTLKGGMEFYITPAEQAPEVQAQLDAITSDELNPEELTLLDPACGSGHILVEAYDLFKTIYLERGYRPRDIPRLILEKNLFGLDIDDRAVQLARFALLMKARSDDRHILNSKNPVQLNVFAFQDSKGLDIEQISRTLLKERSKPLASGQQQLYLMQPPTRQLTMTTTEKPDVTPEELYALLHIFEQAKTFGSLLRVPCKLKTALPRLERLLEKASNDEKMANYKLRLMPLVRQAQLLAREYDCVVANPPYMGGKGQNPAVKAYAKDNFPDSKADLFAMFMERALELIIHNGLAGMITIPNWMFLSSFESLRINLLEHSIVESLIHNGRGVWGSDFGSCSFVVRKIKNPDFQGVFKRLFEKQGSVTSNDELCIRFFSSRFYTASVTDFMKITGSPIAYWAGNEIFNIFEKSKSIKTIATIHRGISTGNTDLFSRFWYEIPSNHFCLNASDRESAMLSGARWFPYNRGGSFRKWYGLGIDVLDYEDGGRRMIEATGRGESPGFRHDGSNEYFHPTITWSALTAGKPSFRLLEAGYVLGHKGSSIKTSDSNRFFLLALLNSNSLEKFLEYISPTLDINIFQISCLPLPEILNSDLAASITSRLVNISKNDWGSFETAWEFSTAPILNSDYYHSTLKGTFTHLQIFWNTQTREMLQLEQENNQFFIDAYRLQDKLTSDVPLHEITLTSNPSYRYGPRKTDEEYETLQRTDTMRELISFAIGCMMGRYSLDEPGLIYAHAENEGFNPNRYATFPADEDGIIPVMDGDWFDDDATVRFVDFMHTVWPAETLDENLKFVADSLDPKKHETPVETIRRFISSKFFKDHHIKVYKKRPIYWLFSSGKHKAFECLVYLHRYNANTLPRMRAMYVTPLQGKFNARIEYLKKELDTAPSTASRKQLQKELDTITKKQQELRSFDELLRHYADQRITLDLDDGVKVNYGKFGALLAEVKTIAIDVAE